MAGEIKFGSGVDLLGQKAVHLADGVSADDAATWGQVQAFLAGLAWKDEVEAASTTNVDISSTPASIDGVPTTVGMRVLLKDQADGKQNGIYVCGAPGAAMTRSTDADTKAKLNNATVSVTSGTNGAGKAYTQSVPNPTVGTSNLTFVLFGAGMTYSNGNGLTLSGSTFSVKLPSSGVVGLVVDSTGLYIDTTVVVRKFVTDVGDGTSTTIDVTHNLGTLDVQVQVRDNVTREQVIVYNQPKGGTDVNKITLTFSYAPTSGQYRVIVQA